MGEHAMTMMTTHTKREVGVIFRIGSVAGIVGALLAMVGLPPLRSRGPQPPADAPLLSISRLLVAPAFTHPEAPHEMNAVPATMDLLVPKGP